MTAWLPWLPVAGGTSLGVGLGPASPVPRVLRSRASLPPPARTLASSPLVARKFRKTVERQTPCRVPNHASPWKAGVFFFLEVTLICLTLADCSGMKSSCFFCPHAGEQRQKNSSGSFSKGRWCLTGRSQGLAARQLHVGLLDLPRWTRGGLVKQQKSASPLGFLETQKAAAASAPGGATPQYLLPRGGRHHPVP